MKKMLTLVILGLVLSAHVTFAQDDNSETELQGILDAFEDDKSESVEGMKVDLKSIQFQTGTDKLVTTDTKYIDKILDYFKSLPTVLLVIEGHTDNVGNKRSNQILSEKRALAVKNYLVEKGVSTDRIKTVGFGPTLPIAANDTDEGRKQNRRVELKFSGVSNETHTINLTDGSQVKAQFVMINKDGSIGYKETLKSPMKKLKAPEIRNIAFHGGTNYVPKDDPMVIRKTEVAAEAAKRAAEDPAVKEQELREKKMREELLLKEQQLREQQERERKLREEKELAEAMAPSDSWFGKIVKWIQGIKLGKRGTASKSEANSKTIETTPTPDVSTTPQGGTNTSPGGTSSSKTVTKSTRPVKTIKPSRVAYTQVRFFYGGGLYPIIVKGNHTLSYNETGSTGSFSKAVKEGNKGAGFSFGFEWATRKEYVMNLAFQHAFNSSVNSSFWTVGLGKGFGDRKNLKLGADFSFSHVKAALDKRNIFLKNGFFTLTPNVSLDLYGNRKGKVRLTAGFAFSALRSQRMKFDRPNSLFADYKKLDDASVDFKVDGVRQTDMKMFNILGPQISIIQVIH